MRRAVVQGALINLSKNVVRFSIEQLLFTVLLFLATGRVGRERQSVSIEEKNSCPPLETGIVNGVT